MAPRTGGQHGGSRAVVAAGRGVEAKDENWRVVSEISSAGRVGWELFGSRSGSAWGVEKERCCFVRGIRWILAAQ